MIIWSPFIMDELAGLRDSAPPTFNVDPTSNELAQKTGFITNFSGPNNKKGAAWADIRYFGITADADTDEAKKFIMYSMDEGYASTLSIAPEGKFPVRRGNSSDPNAFTKAWNAIELLNQHAPRVDIAVNSILTPYNLDSLRGLRKQLIETFPDIYTKYLPLTHHELFLNPTHKSFTLEGRQPATLDQIKTFLNEAILDPKVINSTLFLRKAILYFAGEKDILSKQKQCLYPYFSIQFDSKGGAYPCLTGCDSNENQTDGNLKTYINSPNFQKLQNKFR